MNAIYARQLVAGHNFLAFFGPVVVSFAKISGLSNELNIETIAEGGVNDGMVMLQGSRKTLGTVTFEHGIGMLHPLNIQFEVANNLGLLVAMPTTILVFDNKKDLKRAVGYNGGVPVKWTFTDLDAQSGTIVIDRIEVRHQGVFNVPV